MALIFCHIFIIPLNLFENWPDWLLYLSVSVIFYLLRLLLFSADLLYYGDPEKNKYVKAFQMYWPSRHLASKFNFPQEDASFYWFDKFFSTWDNPDHPRNSQWKRTLIRGYSCRFTLATISFFSTKIINSLPMVEAPDIL